MFKFSGEFVSIIYIVLNFFKVAFAFGSKNFINYSSNHITSFLSLKIV